VIKLSLFSVGLLLSLSAVACATSGEDAASGDEADSTGSRVTPGEFELGDAPHSVPTDCDVHTHLSLKDSPSTATLTEVVGGMCRLAVQPNERTYKLHLKQTDCGSLIYTGSLKDGRSITITDNRARTCEDVLEALVVVQETNLSSYDSTTKTMYSRDPATGAGAAITVTGKLVHTVGIGGENTGSSIQNADGTTELVLDAGEVNQFIENKTARVSGTVTYLNGVETHDRKAIDVTEIVVCPDPSTINCVPGPTVRLSNLCSNDNQTWVKANCPGVNYVF
jgi:hypothetical protein